MNKNYCPYCMTPVPEGETCMVCKLTEGTYVPSPHHLPPGTILMGRYLVGRVLGEGGFGITYIGRDLRLELKVAVKEYYPVDRATRNASASLTVTNFIGPSQKSFERGRQKFLDEAQVMARMDKQQVIVSVRDFFETNNTAYIVMEYIEGITFRELVEKKGGRIAPDELFLLIEPLLRALSIMHENGLIHRDISPDNLMLEDGRVRLLDFGCAREASRGTETMTIALKHGYAPIEQYQQKGQGPWTDIYALCATIYYCLTGRIPPQALDRITEDELLPPSKLGVDLTAEQEQALLKGMRLQPNRRYASARELWAALYAPQTLPATDGEAPQQELATAGETPQPKPVTAGETPQRAKDEKGAARYAPESAAPAAENEKGAERPGEAKSGLLPSLAARKKPFLLAAGALVACVVLAAAVWAAGTRSEETAGAVAGAGVQTAQNLSRLVKSALFCGAYVFSGDDGEEFARLMEDDSVRVVVVEGESVRAARITITKPVCLAEGAGLDADVMTVTGSGYLQVEGLLRMGGAAYLRLEGDTERVCIAESGTFDWSGMGLIWMDCKECLAESEELPGQKLVFSADRFEQEDVVSVRDYASLVSAAGAGKAISIDADIVLKESVHFQAPVKITGGVTVRTELSDTECCFNLVEGAVLYNDGVFEGRLQAFDAAVVNNASIHAPSREEPASLWIEGDSLMVNLGDLSAGDVSRFWEGTALYNLGGLYAYDFYLVGGDMANFGKVSLLDRDSRFEVANGSRFMNAAGAAVTVAAGAEFINDGWFHNLGDVTIRKTGVFQNTVLENYGCFRVESVADIDQDRTGIYCGSGEYDFGNIDVHVFATDRGNLIGEKKLAQAANEEELAEALERADVPGVLITANVAVESDLTVEKAVYVDAGCSLTLSGGAKLTDYGGAIVLRENASLQGSEFVLSEGAQIYLNDGARVAVGEGGSLVLDNALLWGEGTARISGAKLVLRNAASVALAWLGGLELDGSEITLQKDSAFVAPFDAGLRADNAVITLEGDDGRASFYAAQDTALTNCTLNIEAGLLCNRAKNMDLRNCTVKIGESARWLSETSNLSLLAGTTVDNRGMIHVGGWDEYAFVAQGPIANYGSLTLSLKNMRISETIDNQGELYYSVGSGVSFDAGRYVAGNAPVDLDQE